MYFGGSNNDSATGMAVDPNGNVYVAGMTSSTDFPVTSGAFNSTPQSTFMFRLNPDGSVGYSTLFSSAATLSGMAVDSIGEVFLVGTAQPGFPVTPGAFMQTPVNTVCNPVGGPLCFDYMSMFLTKFASSGASLVFSTILATVLFSAPELALPDGTAYVLGSNTEQTTLYHVNATGSGLIGSATVPGVAPMALAPDGSLFLANIIDGFGPAGTPGAFEPIPPAIPILPGIGEAGSSYASLERLNPATGNILESTFLGGFYFSQINSMAFDSSGNLIAGGFTAPRGFPTRTPLANPIGPQSGFIAQLTPDLSTLLFSTYLGDTDPFTTQSVAVSADGDILIAGNTTNHVWVNSIIPAPPQPLRIDSVVNAASQLSVPLSPSETIAICGSGFGTDAQVSVGGFNAPVIGYSSTCLTAAVPSGVHPGGANLQVETGGAVSNTVIVLVASAAPGIFSADGSGFGQGYILNADGTLNSQSNPAAAGSEITLWVTGAGISGQPAAVFVNGIPAPLVSAAFGQVPGLPGIVDQITVTVRSSAVALGSPAGVIVQVNGANSQSGIELYISH